MRKLLNTLYVSTQGVYLHRDGETVVAEREQKVAMRLPIHTLQAIVCFGNVLVSPFLLGLCAERGVYVSFLTEYGRPMAQIEGGKNSNVLLRVAQMHAADNPRLSADIARNVVAGKILNARTILQRRLRDHGADEACVAWRNSPMSFCASVRRTRWRWCADSRGRRRLIISRLSTVFWWLSGKISA